MVIGEVIVDKDELAILQMNPKFCVMKRLIDEEIERDIELSTTKLRYEISALEEKLKLESLHESYPKGAGAPKNVRNENKRARLTTEDSSESADKLK